MTAIHASADTLEAYVMGTLVGADADLLERHAAGCELCAHALAVESRVEEKMYAIAAATAGVVALEPVWRPNGASALRALASEATAVAESAPPAPPSVAPPLSEVWQMPHAAPRKVRWEWAVLAAGIACLCTAAGIQIGVHWRTPPVPPVVFTDEPISADNGNAGVVATQPGSVAPVQVAPAAAVVVAKPAAHLPAARTARVRATHVASLAEKTPSSGNGMADFFAVPAARAELKETLDRTDVLSSIKKIIPTIHGCAKTYVAAGGQLTALKLVTRFVIVPSGTTSGQELVNSELKGTALEVCVVGALKTLQFPPYQSGNIPVTFPIPISGNLANP